MDKMKLAIESLKTHIDYDKKTNGMQTRTIPIGIAEAEAILELLKEQEAANLYKYPNCGTWVSAENVVRCNDCKKRNSWECWQYFFGRIKIPDDWFCADGERRTDDA